MNTWLLKAGLKDGSLYITKLNQILYTLMISCQSADFCSFHHFSPGDLYRILKFNQAARNKVV